MSGRKFDVAGAGASGTEVDGELLLATGRGRCAKVFSSAVASNPDGMDHLVTYQVNGTGQPASVYLLCWEDKFAGKSDRDYNDLVVEVQAAEIAARAPFTQPLLIPLPPPAWTGLAGLLGLRLSHRSASVAPAKCQPESKATTARKPLGGSRPLCCDIANFVLRPRILRRHLVRPSGHTVRPAVPVSARGAGELAVLFGLGGLTPAGRAATAKPTDTGHVGTIRTHPLPTLAAGGPGFLRRKLVPYPFRAPPCRLFGQFRAAVRCS